MLPVGRSREADKCTTEGQQGPPSSSSGDGEGVAAVLTGASDHCASTRRQRQRWARQVAADIFPASGDVSIIAAACFGTGRVLRSLDSQPRVSWTCQRRAAHACRALHAGVAKPGRDVGFLGACCGGRATSPSHDGTLEFHLHIRRDPKVNE